MAQSIGDKIIKLAEKDELEIKCSAIKILGVLGIKSKKLNTVLAKNLSAQNSLLRRVSLEAMGRIGSREYVEVIVPYALKDDEEGQLARQILEQIGSSAFGPLKKQFSKSSDFQKRLLIPLISSINTAPARTFLLDVILTGSLEILKQVCFSLRTPIEKMSPSDKRSFFMQIKQYVKQAEKEKKFAALTSYIILLGFIKNQTSKTVILEYLKEKWERFYYIKKNALLALSRLNLSGKHDDVASVLFPLLDRADTYACEHIVNILKRISFSKTFNKKIEQLLTHRNPDVKAFALSCMGHADSKENVKRMLASLDSSDGTVRAAAQKALSTMPTALSALLAFIDNCEESKDMHALGHILREQSNSFTLVKRKAVFQKMDQCLRKNNPKYKQYFTVLRIAVPDFIYASVFDKIKQLKNTKKIDLAEQYSRLLMHGSFYTDEVKYERAVVCLKKSAHTLSSAYRNTDECLRLFESLLKSSDMALIKRLKKEKILDLSDFFYVGFHFSEKLFELRDFGIDILRFIVKKSPRAQVASKAKKKLKQVGG